MDRDEKLQQAADLSNFADLATAAADQFIHAQPAIEAQLISLLATPGMIPILVGEPGVGKSCLVQNVALRIATAVGDVPTALKGHRIVQVDPSTLLAEALYANQLEHKVLLLARNILGGKAVLFFDEIETFADTGASSTHEDGDVLTLLLPYIKRGTGLRLIGSTTPHGWQRLALQRPAFVQRCVPVHVKPLPPAEAAQVLDGHADRIAHRTGFIVEGEALEMAAELAAALHPTSRAPGGACHVLQKALAYQRARFERDPTQRRITAETLVDGIQEATGVSRFLLASADTLPRAELGARLRQQVLGQDRAVEIIADRVNLIQHRLCDGGRPLGTFLLTGPTGVGKTELAKAVGALLHGRDDALVRFDMSEFQSPDSTARFIGSGRRRHDGRITLVDAALARPFPVILLDEVEKSHAAVFDVLLQVFGEARLTDGAGRLARFDTALFLMTSNLATRDASVGFTPRSASRADQANEIPRAIREFFRLEFLNRLTAIVSFEPLSDDTLREIARREVARLAQRSGLRRRNLTVAMTEAALESLVAAGSSREFGARPMQRTVESQIGGAIAGVLEVRPDIRDTTIQIGLDPGTGRHTATVGQIELPRQFRSRRRSPLCVVHLSDVQVASQGGRP